MNNLIKQLISGNLATARSLAAPLSYRTIQDHCWTVMGWSRDRSVLAAHYLKTGNNLKEFLQAYE